jgi:regulator of sigma E protease
MTVLAAILVFCLLILSHELGHFIMAKLNGIYVYDFSLGMGPKLFSIKGKETAYTLRLFPIGGHCLMMGEDEESDNERSFGKKKVWQRILVIAGGPAMNFLTAVLLFVITFMFMGEPHPSNKVDVMPGKAAEEAGMLSGDLIVQINEQPTNTWTDIPAVMAGASETGQAVNVAVQRDDKIITITIQPFLEDGYWRIGILWAGEIVFIRHGFFSAISLGVTESYQFTKALLSALVGMVAGTVPPDVAGPVGIVNIIGEVARSGLQFLLMLTAFLSINLGVINLLPIPALDGSRIVFLLVEGLRGKPIKPEREGMVHFIGFMLLIGLIILVTYNDIIRLIAEKTT